VSLRRRITIASAAAVAIAVVLGSALTYVLTSKQLHGQVDSQLRKRASGIVERAEGRLGRRLPSLGSSGPQLSLPTRPSQVLGYQQLVDARGHVVSRAPHDSTPAITLPVDAATVRLAARGGQPFFRDTHVQGVHLRILADPVNSHLALQVAEPLTEVDSLLARLRLILVLLDVGGVALAALLGLLVAGAAVAPVRRLTRAAEHVARTRDLSGRIAQTGVDEVGRLARSFNAMLDALESSMRALDQSVHAQRQLVADASHELRTPVTSVRTNIEILQRAPEMAPVDRARLLDEVVEQIEELTLLMNDLIELARGEQPSIEHEEVRLDHLLAEAVERARVHAPSTPIELQVEPTLLLGASGRLQRAINNLLDNAIKHGARGEPVEVALKDGELSVRDHGKGIAPSDLPHIFDRFYRGAEARGRPGSGLGLAIVRQVTERHGGTVTAQKAPGGGTVMLLRFPQAETLSGLPASEAERSVA
jgi:two-component system, OmpR family, sensor histidine kinase MprB